MVQLPHTCAMCVSEGAPANGFLVDNLDNASQELNVTGVKLKSEIKKSYLQVYLEVEYG
jgi:hypothetical protein